MKRIIALLLTLTCLFTLVGCGGSNTKQLTDEEKFQQAEKIPENEVANVIMDGEKYKGKRIELIGKVSSFEEKDGETVIQLFTTGYLPVYVTTKKKVKFKETENVFVAGIVKGKKTGKNSFGAELSLLEIEGYEFKTGTELPNFKAVKEIVVNKEQKQGGVKITVQKVEIAEKETRVYMSVENNTKETLYFMDTSVKIIQGKKQYDYQYEYGNDYPKISSDILKGIKSEGVITFPKIDENSSFKIQLSEKTFITSDDFKDFIFEIKP